VSSFIIERQKDRIFFLFSSICCASSKLAFMNELRASSMGTAEKSLGCSQVQFTMPFFVGFSGWGKAAGFSFSVRLLCRLLFEEPLLRPDNRSKLARVDHNGNHSFDSIIQRNGTPLRDSSRLLQSKNSRQKPESGQQNIRYNADYSPLNLLAKTVKAYIC
jgi:hypothetical protein